MLSTSKVKIFDPVKSLYKKNLQGFIPLYDRKRNCVCIPDTLINHYLKDQLGNLDGLKSVHFASKKDFCLINISAKKLLTDIDIELKLVVDSFNLSQSEAFILFKCDEGAKIQGKNWTGKTMALIARTLLQLLVIKNPHERKMNLSETSVDINWPEIRVDLSTCEPYTKLKQKQLLGLNIFDMVSFNELFFETGQCNVRVISTLL